MLLHSIKLFSLLMQQHVLCISKPFPIFKAPFFFSFLEDVMGFLIKSEVMRRGLYVPK